MSKKRWASLSRNAQDALNKVKRRAGANPIGRSWAEAEKAGMKIGRDNRNTIEQITPAEFKKCRARTDRTFVVYLAKMT